MPTWRPLRSTSSGTVRLSIFSIAGSVALINCSRNLVGIPVAIAFLVAGCATTETSRTIDVPKVQAAASTYTGPRAQITVGKFDNRSSYMRGVFSDGIDRVGDQAKLTLVSHLQQSNRFAVQDRDNMSETGAEAKIQGTTQQLRGAKYVVTGAVTEFGRKEVGDQQFFGVLGRGKQQIAYAKVTLNVIDTTTSEVAFSSQGAGEYALSNREVLGFGSTASYDSTLTGKVLDLAMREAVNGLVTGLDAGRWGRGQ